MRQEGRALLDAWKGPRSSNVMGHGLSTTRSCKLSLAVLDLTDGGSKSVTSYMVCARFYKIFLTSDVGVSVVRATCRGQRVWIVRISQQQQRRNAPFLMKSRVDLIA